MSAETDVAIVGAGPYGLSIAAHLRARGVDHRIVGNPMQFWRAHMPVGMLLKSDGFASDIFDPEGRFPLARYCEGEGISYADIGIPVRVETFTAYGMAFQQRYAPALENKTLVALRTSPTGFELRLQNGELLTARRVVLAIGIKDFSQVPEELAHLPPEFLSHSSEHSHLGRFSGREVTVIGSAASAVDLAVLLHESGAMVQLLARKLSIKFHNKMELPRPLWDRVRSPVTGIGPGWRYVAFSEAPLAVHYLPGAVRHA
ncbi:MAG: NAD(P)-binding domain-containing protein, partial [Haliea sp.]